MSVVWAVSITITYYRTCVFARTVTHFVRQTRSVHQVLSIGACDSANGQQAHAERHSLAATLETAKHFPEQE